MNAPADILYRPRGRFRSRQAGAHPSSEVGGFGVFRDQTPFLRHPDARRIDIRATLRDPFGATIVRRFEQRSPVDVYAIVDLSASMSCIGASRKFDLARDICAALAFSATRIGDRFGLLGCDDRVRPDVHTPATRSRAVALRAADRLADARRDGAGARGFIDAAAMLGASRRLALLISDFRWPASLIDRVFDSFAPHDTIPLVLVDSMEETPPEWGLAELTDAETNRRRVFVMRPRLRGQWIERERDRRAMIARLAANRVRPPIVLRDALDPVELSRRLTAA